MTWTCKQRECIIWLFFTGSEQRIMAYIYECKTSIIVESMLLKLCERFMFTLQLIYSQNEQKSTIYN